MKRILLWAPVALTLAGLPTLALAQQPDPQKIIERMDRNGDGKLSRQEFRGPPQRFGLIDANGDGFLTVEEFRARIGANAGKEAANLGKIAWIDTHTHPAGGRGDAADYGSAVRGALEAMEGSGFERAILMPTPQSRVARSTFALEDFLGQARKYPDRFAVMGGGGTLNPMIHAEGRDGRASEGLKRRFEKRAEEILARGAVGFGEMSILHLSLAEGHPYESVPGDHPLLLLLADIAARHDVVIDIHFDLVREDMATPDWLSVPPNPRRLDANIAGFERFLAHNRKAKIVWAHAGSDNVGHRTADFTRQMLEKHPNLYMSLRMIPAHVPAIHPLSPAGIEPGWLRVLSDFSDRFVLGGDQFFVSAQTTGPAAQFGQFANRVRARSNIFLAKLPEALARKIGYENPVRLYKLDSAQR